MEIGDPCYFHEDKGGLGAFSAPFQFAGLMLEDPKMIQNCCPVWLIMLKCSLGNAT